MQSHIFSIMNFWPVQNCQAPTRDKSTDQGNCTGFCVHLHKIIYKICSWRVDKSDISRFLLQSVTNLFKYSNIQIFLIIRIFIRIIFWIGIYSDIRSCQLFGYEYIRIFVRTNFQDTNKFWRCFYLISLDITLCLIWIFCW